jgi:legumain
MSLRAGFAVAACFAAAMEGVQADAPAEGIKNTWAVIAAGSSSYSNYRHQADACHAYQVLLKQGVPAEQIILMMQDDVASSSENPFKGKLYNKPGNDSPDVYAGCKVDYRGSVVTAALFLAVITGDEAHVPSGGKVLKSKSTDRVFLNFVDHGGVGIVAFPNGPLLHASDLATALAKMETKKMYSELLFYMEACESGSMFPGLKTDSKVFAVTASNAKESSWGFYCMPNDKVNGKDMQTCLGDLFSISWLEDSDRQTKSETIKTQVGLVTKRTNKSHVMTFGDVSFESEPFGNFELRGEAASSGDVVVPQLPADSMDGAWDVRDIPLKLAYRNWQSATDAWAKKAAFDKLQRVTAGRAADEEVFRKMSASICKGQPYGCSYSIQHAHHEMTEMECHKDLATVVHEACPRRAQHNPGGWNAFNMKFSQLLVNTCEKRSLYGHHVEDLKKIVHAECSASSVAWQATAEASRDGDTVVV